eukprot:g18110.t1
MVLGPGLRVRVVLGQQGLVLGCGHRASPSRGYRGLGFTFSFSSQHPLDLQGRGLIMLKIPTFVVFVHAPQMQLGGRQKGAASFHRLALQTMATIISLLAQAGKASVDGDQPGEEEVCHKRPMHSVEKRSACLSSSRVHEHDHSPAVVHRLYQDKDN